MRAWLAVGILWGWGATAQANANTKTDTKADAETENNAEAEAEVEDLGKHLRDAMALNRSRAPRYAAATGGASRPISRQLIRSERWAWLLSGLVDGPARRYRQAGVPLLAEELVSLSLAPPLVLPGPTPWPSLLAYVPAPLEAIQRDMTAAVAAGDFAQVESSARLWLTETSRVAGMNCMTGHVLESVVAIGHLAPAHVQAAAAAGLADPSRLLERLLRQHVRLLPRAALLDLRAAPLQAAGVPILCQDVPPILSTLGLEQALDDARTNMDVPGGISGI